MANLYSLKKDSKTSVLSKIKRLDFLLIIAVLLLSGIGVLAVGSADETLYSRQLIGVLGSAVIMILTALFIDYKRLLKFFIPLYIIILILLLYVYFAGHDSHGASRWIAVAGFTFQPSEPAKIIIILFFAQYITKFKERMSAPLLYGSCILLFLPALVLVFVQPDFSTSIMLVIIFAMALFVGGIDRRVVAAVFILAIPLAVAMIYTADALPDGAHPILEEYQQLRIKAWLHPEDYSTDEAMQTLNSLIAIGSGGLTGKGINNNEITSVLNSGYISESETDLIFTVIGEEMGFAGGMLVIVLLLIIALRCLRAAFKSDDLAARIICCSVGSWIGLQGFMNIGVATGLIPSTGIPLPFVSSGLSSLVSAFGAIGVVLNIGTQIRPRYS